MLNSILVYPNKDIVNNHVDFNSKSILMTQKKGMPFLCKGVASIKPDIMVVAYHLLILYSIFSRIN